MLGTAVAAIGGMVTATGAVTGTATEVDEGGACANASVLVRSVTTARSGARVLTTP
jgi:hypothetical protein